MSENIELKVGDVVQLKVPFTAVVTENGISFNMTVEVGELFVVSGFDGSNVLLQCTLKMNKTHIDFVLHVEPENLQAFEPVQTDEGGETQPPPTQPPPEETMCEKRRYSKATIRATTKRPEVFLYQGANSKIDPEYTGGIDGWYGAGSAEGMKGFQTANGLEPVDGIIGGDTATELIKQATAAGFEADLNLRIMSVIAYYEVGNRADAFGMAENDIGDDAGANYGIWQCNSLGSVNSMLKLAGRNDLVAVYNGTDKSVVNPTIEDWFGSSEGIRTQVRYLEEKLLPIAMRELREFGSFDAWENDPEMKLWWERAVLLFVDSVVQNGTMWSPSRRPFWKDLVGAEGRPSSQNIPELYYGTWWDETLGAHIQYEDFKTKWWAEKEKQDAAYPDDSRKAMKTANRLCAKDVVDNVIPCDKPSEKLLVVAQIRSRSSSPTWWYQAVASRRVTDATGDSANHPSGVVNGGHLVLACDYQI